MRGRFFPDRHLSNWEVERQCGMTLGVTGVEQSEEERQRMIRMGELRYNPIGFIGDHAPVNGSLETVWPMTVEQAAFEASEEVRRAEIRKRWSDRRMLRQQGHLLARRILLQKMREKRELREEEERQRRAERRQAAEADRAAEERHPAYVQVLKPHAPVKEILLSTTADGRPVLSVEVEPSVEPKVKPPTSYLCEYCGWRHSTYQLPECPEMAIDRARNK